MSNFEDKRSTPRIQPFVASCRVVEDKRRFSGHITDLSTRGAQVSCRRLPAPEGSTIVLEVRLGRGTARLSLPARVQWRKPTTGGDTHQFGLTFEGLDAEGLRGLQAVLEEFQLRASQLQ